MNSESGVNISLTAAELKEAVKFRFKEKLKNPTMKLRPLYIQGHAGIGKSQIVKQAARELSEELSKDVNCKVITGVFLEPPDFQGLGHISIDPKDKEELTVFARPSLLPKDGYGIIFLDEANRCNKEIKNGMLTLIEDNEINGHVLGSNWLLILAGNPSGDRYQGASELDPALLDRVCPVWFKGEPKETVKFLEQKYGDHFLVEFIKEHPSLIDFGAKGRGTPRGLEYTIRATREQDELAKKGVVELDRNNMALVNIMGCELGLQLTTHILSTMVKKIKDLSLEEVLTNKTKTTKFLKDNKDNTDIISNVEGRVREYAFDKFKKYSREKELNNVPVFEDTERDHLQSFLENLPPENLLAFIKGLDGDGLDYNLEYVFGLNFIKNSEKIKNFVIKIYESGNQNAEKQG